MKRKLYRRLGLYPWATNGWAESARHPETEMTQKKKLTSFGRKLRMRRQLSVLYGNLRASVYRSLEFQAQSFSSLKRSHLFYLFERRLGTCLLRTNCFASFDHIRSILREKKISVNGKIQRMPGYLCLPGDIIRFPVNNLSSRQEAQTLLGRPSLHLEVDYALGCAIVLLPSNCIELPTPLLAEKG